MVWLVSSSTTIYSGQPSICWRLKLKSIIHPSMVVTISFSYLADKKGRRIVAFLSELGLILAMGWILICKCAIVTQGLH